MSGEAQPGVLAPLAAVGRSLHYRLAEESRPMRALARLRDNFSPDWGVVGLGAPLLTLLGATVPGMRIFPALAGPGVSVPSTQHALWLYLRGEDRGVVFDRSEQADTLLGEDFRREDALDTFTYAGGRDLTAQCSAGSMICAAFATMRRPSATP